MRKLLGWLGEAGMWYALALALAFIGDVLPYNGVIFYGLAVGCVMQAITRTRAEIVRWNRERQMLGG